MGVFLAGPSGYSRARRRACSRTFLAAPQEPPRTPADLLSLWDEATRLEPLVRLRISEPRWRTGEDDVPFTTTPLSRALGTDPVPLPCGKKTADPARIPALVDGLFDFLSTGDLDPVLTAVHVPHLIGRIHPFVDGNGHTGRLLMCDLLARGIWRAHTRGLRRRPSRARESMGRAHGLCLPRPGGCGRARLVSAAHARKGTDGRHASVWRVSHAVVAHRARGPIKPWHTCLGKAVSHEGA